MKNKFLKGIGLNVIFLGLTSFINDISSDMILAVMPFYCLFGRGMCCCRINQWVGRQHSGILKVFQDTAQINLAKRCFLFLEVVLFLALQSYCSLL